MEFISKLKDGTIVLSLYIQPRASRTCIYGVHDGALKLGITASPTDGKANKAVVGFLASVFKIPKRNVTLVSGLQSRRKRCRIAGVSLEDIHQCLDSGNMYPATRCKVSKSRLKGL